MKIASTTLVNTILSTILVTSMFFIGMTTSQSGEYDPWKDLNDDGWIELMDFYELSLAVGTSGDPIKTVVIAGYETNKWAINTIIGPFEFHQFFNNTDGYRQITIVFLAVFWDVTVSVQFDTFGLPFEVDSFVLPYDTNVAKTYQIQGEEIIVSVTTIDYGGIIFFTYYMTP